MKIKYLGTAAAEGIPALFCHCDTCRFARIHGKKEIRTRCQAMIDNEIMIDFGPDTYFHTLTYQLDITDLKYCLITHIHEDHLLPDQFIYRTAGYAVLKEGTEPLYVYGSEDVKKMVMELGENSIGDNKEVQINTIEPYHPVTLGKYKVTAFPAVHGTKNPLFYSIEKENKTILYAHDTDFFTEEIWDYLEKNQMHFQLVSMDCTSGVEKMQYTGHMNFEKNLKLKEKMLEKNIADENTIFVANHFSHNGHAGYAYAVEYMKNDKIMISYDGMEIEI